MYYLMNKDVPAACFDKRNNKWALQHEYSGLPIGKFEINDWIEDRKAYKHNHHLKRLMKDCGCDTAEGFIRITHAASINDSFWIKEENETATWNDISFYKNNFNDTVSRLAFEGLGLYGIQMSSTSPELTTDGSFRKCWKKENGDIYLYKRGVSGAANAGLEPYCEALASEIINTADPSSVRYSVMKFHGETATKCRAFTGEDVGFVPLRKLVDRSITMDGLLTFFDSLGCREKFQKMLVLDAVTFNVDRHLGNIGVLINNDTQKITGIAPNFDFNLSMLPYVTIEEFDHIGTRLLDYGPAIGDDFTRVGQAMLTSEIRKDLINLQGFSFSFRGDRYFEPHRVDIMEELVNRQISAILKGEILYTRDVFVPEKTVQETAVQINDGHIKQASILAGRLKENDVFSSVMEEVGEDDQVYVRATLHYDGDFIDIITNMGTMEIFCEINGLENTAEKIMADFGSFKDIYNYVCMAADSLYEPEY